MLFTACWHGKSLNAQYQLDLIDGFLPDKRKIKTSYCPEIKSPRHKSLAVPRAFIISGIKNAFPHSGEDLNSRIQPLIFPDDLYHAITTKEEKLNIEALCQQHQNELIYHVFGMLHCRNIAADIVQESYIRLSREAERQKIEHPRSLLFRIAHNLALDHLKHRKVMENYAQSLDPTLMPATESPSAEQLASEAQRQHILRQAIDELPPRCRQAFTLHNIHGMSYRDIALELGISESGVEKHIMKGLLHCRKQMKKRLPE